MHESLKKKRKKDLVILVGLSGGIIDVAMCIQQQRQTTVDGLRDLGGRKEDWYAWVARSAVEQEINRVGV